MFVDPSGLELRVYNRPAKGIIGRLGGNHAFLYSTETGEWAGMGASSGRASNTDESGWIRTGSFNTVQNPDGIPEAEVMGYMRDTMNSGIWIPGVHDCHSAVNRVFDHFGLENPGAPGGRIGAIPPRAPAPDVRIGGTQK